MPNPVMVALSCTSEGKYARGGVAVSWEVLGILSNILRLGRFVMVFQYHGESYVNDHPGYVSHQVCVATFSRVTLVPADPTTVPVNDIVELA